MHRLCKAPCLPRCRLTIRCFKGVWGCICCCWDLTIENLLLTLRGKLAVPPLRPLPWNSRTLCRVKALQREILYPERQLEPARLLFLHKHRSASEPLGKSWVEGWGWRVLSTVRSALALIAGDSDRERCCFRLRDCEKGFWAELEQDTWACFRGASSRILGGGNFCFSPAWDLRQRARVASSHHM